MQLPVKGLDKAGILDALERAAGHDLPWRDGGTFAYIYDPGADVEEIAKLAYMRFLTENAIDPTVYPSLLKFETEIVAIAASHLQGDAQVVGNVTTGGTESILLAVKAARDRARQLFPHITRPQLVMPVTAHAAFHKACAYFDVEPVLVPVTDPSWRVSPADMAAAITDQTILLVASAPGYAHGVVDPIAAIAAIAQERGILFHVDGCVGGWMLKFWRQLGAPVPDYDFSIPGVTSISMDFHKYGYAAKPASILLWRNRDLRRHQMFCGADWTGYSVINPTILSTKSGGPLAACWAVLNYLGEEGYLAFARRMMEATARVRAGIGSIEGLRIVGEPDFCMLAFTTDGFSPFPLCDVMRKKGWFIQPQLGFRGSPPNVHLSVGQAMLERIDPFIAALREGVEEVRRLNHAPPPEGIGALLAGLDPAAMDTATFMGLMQAAGMDLNGLPEGTAPINEILNAAPPPVAGALLKEYFNLIYGQARAARAPGA
jgi:glutamate/tyrosine decarboxylase-like PLP-dependent enzyme